MAKSVKDAARGCLVGGGAGDALGYPVEFMREHEIVEEYGPAGITEYQIDPETGTAVVSDDTQMTMFTATGILNFAQDAAEGNAKEEIYRYVWRHYLDWFRTQNQTARGSGQSCLMKIPELYAWRAPGTTCLSALRTGECGTIEEGLNNSKGCSGVMRVAPAAVLRVCGNQEAFASIEEADRAGADIAAITHGHCLGYIPAAALTHVIRRILYGGCVYGTDLHAITEECRDTMRTLFADEYAVRNFEKTMNEAIERSQNDLCDPENIRALGEGWVGDEAFAIALYCSLRHSDDFGAALIAAVNHDGDSDSTGAITGNIMGALVGYEKIEEKWKKNLQFEPELLKLADALMAGSMEHFGIG